MKDRRMNRNTKRQRERDRPSREYTERVNSGGTENIVRALAVLHPLALSSHQTNTVTVCTQSFQAQPTYETQTHKSTHVYCLTYATVQLTNVAEEINVSCLGCEMKCL